MADSHDSPFHAHSRNDGGAGVAEPLRTHLGLVAERAAGFAAAFSAEQQARAAGSLHDLGKYADQFQRRLTDARERGRDRVAASNRGRKTLARLAFALWHAAKHRLLPLSPFLGVETLPTKEAVPGIRACPSRGPLSAHESQKRRFNPRPHMAGENEKTPSQRPRGG